MNVYLKLMRVDQYLKNIMVLLPLLFGGQLFVEGKALPALIGTGLFCIVSSAVYIMNDIADADNDAKNPAKCDRPIASGKVKKNVAIAMCVTFAVGSVILTYVLLSPLATLWIGIYFVMNIFYSMGLKNIIVVDVAMIVAGFVIRVFYGSIITDIDVSKWLYVMIACLLTFTTVGKRINEKRRMDRNGICIRKVLLKCSEKTLSICLYLALILLNITYIIWIVDIIPYCDTNPLWTIPIMIVFSWKSFVIIENNTTDKDPLPLFIKDTMWVLALILLISSIVSTFYVDVPFINDGIEVFK